MTQTVFENAIEAEGLIKRYGEKTGVPVILNTSFNENEPIVCKPEEAVDCFLRTKMDVLVIGPFVCKKDTNQDESAVASSEAKTSQD